MENHNKFRVFRLRNLLFLFIFAILLFVIALPTLLSTATGQNLLISYIDDQIPGKFSAKSINFSWFGPQTAEDIVLSENEVQLLSCKSIQVDDSIWTILRNRRPNKATLSGLNIHITSKDNKPISITNTTAFLDISKLGKETIVTLQGDAHDGSLAGHFDIDLLAKKIDSDKGEIELHVSVDHFPTYIIDQLTYFYRPSLAGIASQALGSEINLQINNASDKNQFNVNFKADNLHIDLIGKVLWEQYALNVNGQTTFTTNPEILEKLLSIYGLQQDIQVKSLSGKDIATTLIINELQIPLGAHSPTDRKIQAKLLIDPIRIESDSNSFSIQNVNAAIDRTDAIPPKFLLQGDIIPAPDTPLSLYLGKEIHLALESSINIDHKSKNNFNPTKISLKSDSARINIYGSFSRNREILLTQPIEIAYTLQKDVLASLNSEFTLAHPAEIHCSINPPKGRMQFNKLKYLSFTGRVSLDDLVVVGDNGNNVVGSIEDVEAPFEINFAQNQAVISLTGKTSLPGRKQTGSLKGSLILSDFFKKNALDIASSTVQTNVQFSRIPTAVLEAFSGYHILSDLVGNAMDISIQGEKNGPFEMALRGDGIQASASFYLNDIKKLKDPSKPITLAWKVSPERFKSLRKLMLPENSPERLVLVEPMNITASIQEITFPSNGNWLTAGMAAELFIDKFDVYDNVYEQKLVFEGFVAQLKSENLSQSSNFNIVAKQVDEQHAMSDLSISGTLENPFNQAGKLNLHDLSLSFEAKAAKLPAGVLGELTRMDPSIRDKLIALLGPRIDIEAKVFLQKMNGPIQAKLQGKNGYFIFDGRAENGILTLQSPLEAVVLATPELGQNVLQHIIPLLSGTIGANDPLKFTISPEGFSFPIKDFDNSRVQVGKATIDLGVMYLQNEGQIAKILSVFGTEKKEQIVVWFTPAYFQIQSGVVKLERMDMLISNTYPIAIWGVVDLPSDKIDMTIGLSGAALQKAFKVPSLDSHYMMTLPFRGRIGKASLDKTKVTTKLSALTAQLLGGPQGLVIGTAIQLATSAMEEKVPNPTTNPLPWQTSNSSSSQENAPRNNTNYTPQQTKKKSSAIKNIGEGAGSFLKKIFR